MRTIETIEELHSLIGQEVAVGDWFTVDQSRIDAFADATGDHQFLLRWKGLRPPRLSSLRCNQGRELFQVAFAVRRLNRVRFPAPVLAGARIRPRFTLQSLEEFDEGYQAVWAVNMEVEGGRKPALYAEWVVRLYT